MIDSRNGKELLYQERMKDSVRLGISLNNLNTEEKRAVVVQLNLFFSTCRLQQELNVKNNIICLYLKVLLRKTTLNG
jgi:hypothetical protein